MKLKARRITSRHTNDTEYLTDLISPSGSLRLNHHGKGSGRAAVSKQCKPSDNCSFPLCSHFIVLSLVFASCSSSLLVAPYFPAEHHFHLLKWCKTTNKVLKEFYYTNWNSFSILFDLIAQCTPSSLTLRTIVPNMRYSVCLPRDIDLPFVNS
jgi:hypothetical protein